MVGHYGMCSGDDFEKWILQLIKDKTNNSDYTFGKLKEDKILN